MEKTTCPNCNETNTDTNHINRCPDPEQKKLLLQCGEELKEWMIDHHTYPELVEFIPKYLARQGLATFVNLAEACPR